MNRPVSFCAFPDKIPPSKTSDSSDFSVFWLHPFLPHSLCLAWILQAGALR